MGDLLAGHLRPGPEEGEPQTLARAIIGHHQDSDPGALWHWTGFPALAVAFVPGLVLLEPLVDLRSALLPALLPGGLLGLPTGWLRLVVGFRQTAGLAGLAGNAPRGLPLAVFLLALLQELVAGHPIFPFLPPARRLLGRHRSSGAGMDLALLSSLDILAP